MMARIHTGAMTAYSFVVVDRFDIVASIQWIECSNDSSAEETAVSLLGDLCDVEVWDVGRLVCRCSSAQADATNQRRC